MLGEELGTLLRQEQGQFLDFVSAYQLKKGGPQPKHIDDLSREVARVIAGMANADGGTLLVGVDGDRSVTGIPHAMEEVQSLLQAPELLLTPPLHPTREKTHLGNLLLLKFEVGPALQVHRMSGGRTFYRIAGDNLSMAPEQIQRLREAKVAFHYDRQTIREAAWEDLDHEAIDAFREKIGDARDPQTLLMRGYHLLEGPTERPRVRMATLLLFAKDPSQWHPRCGIDFVKFEGTERQHGSSLNVVKRIRFEAPLCHLIDEAVGRIKEQIRERVVLHDLFFREQLEYPAFAWQEALVNAVAHRDYGLTGSSIEVWMFDDHIEIRSPGPLPSPVTLEDLRLQRRIHFSRNPLLVRVLADLGYLREMGEGVPRMHQEMERSGLRPPEFTTEGFFLTVTLRNTPVYDEATLRWLNQFRASDLNFRQKRLLVYAYSHGKVLSTAEYQRVGEVDRDTAYREIRTLVRLGILAPVRPKSRTYRIIEGI